MTSRCQAWTTVQTAGQEPRKGAWRTIRFGLVGEKVNHLNSVLLPLSLPPSQTLSEICPFSISEDRLPAVALQGGESERRQDGSLPWLEKPHIFPTENWALAMFSLLSDTSSIWLYLDQSLEQDF